MLKDRSGMSTLAKVLLIGVATVGALFVVVIVAGLLFLREAANNPDFLEGLSGAMEDGAMTELADVGRDFDAAVVDAATIVLDEAVVEAAEAGSGHTFTVEPFEGEAASFDLVAVSEFLDGVRAGELSFADGGRDAAGDGTEEGRAAEPPNWVLVYPGARREAGVFAEFQEFSFGVDVVLSDSMPEEVLEWYRDADTRGGWSVQRVRTVSDDREGAEQLRHASLRISTRNRRMLVMIGGDRERHSVIVTVYKD